LESEEKLPKRVVAYIHDMGVRALDHLAANVELPAAPPDGEAAAPNAVQTLVSHWTAMSKEHKEQFVEMVAESVVAVVAASAALPLGLKLGKKAVKATRKVLKKQTKKFRKASKPKTKVKK
jgi:hypothetical protein